MPTYAYADTVVLWRRRQLCLRRRGNLARSHAHIAAQRKTNLLHAWPLKADLLHLLENTFDWKVQYFR